MPWRGPEAPGEYPTLGWLVGEWIEEWCVIPDGNHAGETYRLTDEMWRFLLWHYRIHPDAVGDPDKPRRAFVYRRSQLVRPQKWGKGPLAAAIICAEAEGPVLFDGWDSAGEPVGRPWATPWIQVTAASEDQTDNIWRALQPMIEQGPLADLIPDTGETRINLPAGGYIEPVTSSARSRLGQRITHSAQDETHSWLETNGGRRLAENQRRNLAGMGGRSIEYTNAWNPAENSVAQRTAEAKANDVYRDHVEPKTRGSTKNKRELRRMLQQVYGDSWWVDLDAIAGEFSEIAETDPQQAERFFLNRVLAAADAAFDPTRWAQLAKPDLAIPAGELVVAGFDGAKFFDATAIVATHVETGHQWPVRIWQSDPDDPDWEVPDAEVHAAVDELFERWKVLRFYADPPYWETPVATWAGKYRWGGKDRVFEWWTHRERQAAFMCRAYKGAQTSGELSHNGDPTFADHIGNTRSRPTRAKDDEGKPMWTMGKPARKARLFIDAAMAGGLSWQARLDAIADGALQKKKTTKVVVMR